MDENDHDVLSEDLFASTDEWETDNDVYDPLEPHIDDLDEDEWDTANNPSFNVPDTVPEEEPATPKPKGIFTPERAGSVHAALSQMLTSNPGRRPILLAIIDATRDGMGASALNDKIVALQADNYSIYSPASYCHMLESAGALTFEAPELDDEPDEIEEDENGVAYYVIRKPAEATWRATDEGLAVYDEFSQGNEWRDVVMNTESYFAEVYLAVMQRLDEEPCKKDVINELVKTFPITVEKHRFGMHFIDLLENTGTVAWSNHVWALTDLGHRVLPELVQFCAERAAQSDRQASSDES